MDERLQFVARRLAGEAMAELCREFGISRKTGYKIFDRYLATALLSAVAEPDGARKELLSPWGSAPTSCGVPTTRASSCWGIASAAIR